MIGTIRAKIRRLRCAKKFIKPLPSVRLTYKFLLKILRHALTLRKV
jgi:hypothetical protein